MRKELCLLSCLLALSLAVVATAEDLEPPWFAGADGSGCAIWEFDIDPVIGEVLENPDGEGPTAYGYWPELDGYEFSVWPSYGEVLWDEGGQLLTVDDDETGFYMSIPDGEGSYLTLYAQITWSGGENWPMLEGWSTASREGDCLFSMDGDELDHWGDPVEIEPGVFHQTFYHTFEDEEIPPYVNLLIWWEGCEVYEVIVDAIVHADPEAPDGTGTRPGEWQMQVSNPVPVNKEKHVDPGTNLSFQAPEEALCMWEDDPLDPNDAPPDPNFAGPFEYDVYFGTDKEALGLLQSDYTPENCNDVMVFDPCAGDLELATKYYWRVDINDANGDGDPCFYEGPYFSFSTIGLADNVSPSDGAGDVAVYGTSLKWAGDSFAETFDVYFSTDFNEVDDGDANALVEDNQEPNTYDPGALVLDTEYFWRIDEVNVIALKGDVWSFSTDILTVVDNMDLYHNKNKIDDTWIDGWDLDPENGSDVDLETVIAEDGNSMEYLYQNTVDYGAGYGSRAEALVDSLEEPNLPVGSNWNEIGAKALFLTFYGDPTNTAGVNDKMYVALEDGSGNVGVSYYHDVNDIKIEEWQDWNIDLQDFVDDEPLLDLNDVSKISIGFGVYGGSGAQGTDGYVYFDNILLWASRCVREYAPGDVDGDCEVGIWDLEDMSFDWLESDYNVVSTEPSRDNLLVEYLFTSDLQDTANDYDGIAGDGITVANEYLSIEQGVGDTFHVEVPLGADNPFDGSGDFSISMKFRTDTGGILISSADVVGPNDPNNHSMALFLEDEAEEDWFYKAATYDNFYVGNAGYEDEESDWLSSDWHHIAVTYDADGGICPEDPVDPNACPLGEITGLVKVYVDGIPFKDWEGNFDPNIPDIADDEVHIGDSLNTEYPGEMFEDLKGGYNGDIDEVRIYTEALTHGNVLWLAGMGDTYFPLDSWANLYPKEGPFGWDPDNQDVVNFADFAILADNWLAEEKLWP